MGSVAHYVIVNDNFRIYVSYLRLAVRRLIYICGYVATYCIVLYNVL